MIDNPFMLINRVLIASMRILAYSMVFTVQAICYAVMMKRDKIVDAFGYWGRGVADAIADVFRRK